MSSDMEGKMQSVYDQPHPDELLRREGGPAFPVSIPGCGDNGQHGMTLRDWFAGQALAGLCARDPGSRIFTTGDYAKAAFDMADAMLRERVAERHVCLVGSEAKEDAVRRYDRELSAKEKAPTGDDYNAVLEILGVGP